MKDIFGDQISISDYYIDTKTAELRLKESNKKKIKKENKNMKCLNCGREMLNTIGGNYICDCGFSVNDLVYRSNKSTSDVPSNWNEYSFVSGNQGWVCPKCGAAISPNMAYCPLCSSLPKIEVTYGGLCDTQHTTTTVTTNIGGNNDK